MKNCGNCVKIVEKKKSNNDGGQLDLSIEIYFLEENTHVGVHSPYDANREKKWLINSMFRFACSGRLFAVIVSILMLRIRYDVV